MGKVEDQIERWNNKDRSFVQEIYCFDLEPNNINPRDEIFFETGVYISECGVEVEVMLEFNRVLIANELVVKVTIEPEDDPMGFLFKDYETFMDNLDGICNELEIVARKFDGRIFLFRENFQVRI